MCQVFQCDCEILFCTGKGTKPLFRNVIDGAKAGAIGKIIYQGAIYVTSGLL
jgi:hypothetical protein